MRYLPSSLTKALHKVAIPFVVFFMCSIQANASHIFAADFYYEYINGTNYKVSMAFYGDCAGMSFPYFPTSTPEVTLYNGTSFVSNFFLQLEAPGVEVTPVCESQKNNTKCINPNNTIPGVTRFIYSAVVSINVTSANLRFLFEGNMGGSNAAAGRSNSITNLSFTAGSSTMELEIALNNLNGPNTSPRFTTIPTPFYCVNVAQQYNPGAVDVNNDSLSYALVAAMENGTPVNYATGFSPTNPLSAAPGTFNFNNITGQLGFTPDNTQFSTVVTRVNEYRNGTKIGSAIREMNFVVLANCSGNAPPTGSVDTTAPIIGGLFANPTTFNVCEGTSAITFPIRPVDPEGDTITVTLNGLPSGMTSNITNNNTPHPLVTINWNNMAGLSPGIYTFYLTYKDNGCPISSQQTQAYSVHNVRPNNVTYRTISPTQCWHKAYIEYQLSDGLLPRNVVVKQGNTTIRSFVDNTGTFQDSLAEGTYSVLITSPFLTCPSLVNLTIKDSGVFPFPPTMQDAFYCLNDQPVALTATAFTGGTITYWMDSLFNHFPTPPIPHTDVAGIYKWYVIQRYKVCESLPDTGLVYVTKVPTADFVVAPSTICDRDTVTVSFTGAIGVGPIIDYLWDWSGSNSVTGAPGGPYRVHWPIAGTKTITLQVLENKCPSDTVTHQYVVKPTPTADFTVKNICQYDTLVINYNPTILSNQQFSWTFDGADLPSSTTAGPFYLHWSTGGVKHIFLTVSKDGCVDTASRYPEVYGIPDARILNVPDVNCLGDKIYLEHDVIDAGTTLTWTPKKQVYYEPQPDGRPYIFTLTPTTYTLTLRNAEGCVDSDQVTYDRIEPCCNFGYPNAFTPNNDGHNDRFRIVTYGNDADFSLSIYNRWGQCVYHSGNPKEGWDGKLNGKDSEVGTYYYIFKGKCLTGHEESKNGEFTLIR